MRFENVRASDVSTATTGVKLTYTAPVSGAVVTGVFVSTVAATVVIDVEHTDVSGTAIILKRGAAGAAVELGVPVSLRPNETVRINVSTAAAGTSDMFISAERLVGA